MIPLGDQLFFCNLFSYYHLAWFSPTSLIKSDCWQEKRLRYKKSFLRKGVDFMPSLKNKTCTKLSMIFLICSLLLIMVMMVSWFKDFHGFVLLLHFSEVSMAVVYYPCCLHSGFTLIFSIGTHYKMLKRITAFVHFSSVYVVATKIYLVLLKEG